MEEGAGENVDIEHPYSISELVVALIYNPVNIALLCVIAFLLYQMFSSRKEDANTPLPQVLARLKKQDMTSEQLKKFDGTDEDGRVCVAVNGKIFDVTKGKRFYGPGGPYSAFAGRDASRGLATFSIEVSNKEYDDLSDLNTMQMEGVKEWEIQFQEKYEYVGRLLKPGEEATDYSDEEENSQDQNSSDQASKKDSSPDQSSKKETLSSPKAEENPKSEAPDEEVFQESPLEVEKKQNQGDHLASIAESSDVCEKEEKCQSQNVSQSILSEEPNEEMRETQVD